MMLKNVLKEARDASGLNQEDVADKIGVTKQTYLKWENGITEPKASQIYKISKVLNISANEICQGQIYKKYDLQNFIIKTAKINPKRELEILKIWQFIDDQEKYIKELKQDEDSDPSLK